MKKFSSTVKVSSHRTSSKRHVVPIVVLGILLVVAMLLLPRLFSFVSAIVMSPVVRAETWLAESNAAIPAFFRSRNDLLAEIEDLERQVAMTQSSSGAAKLLQQENQELRALLGASTGERTAAGVIGRPSALPYDVLVIDKGSRDGIDVNAPVYSGKDTVIGFVAAAFPESSVVTLVSTPGFVSTVYIYGPNIYTTAEGMGAGSLRVRVPQGIALSQGDVVIIPSFESGIYGVISVVESIATEPEQYGYVSTDVPLSGLRFVSVGSRPLTSISFDEAKEVVAQVKNDLLTVPVPSGVLVDTASTTASSTVHSSSSELEI